LTGDLAREFNLSAGDVQAVLWLARLRQLIDERAEKVAVTRELREPAALAHLGVADVFVARRISVGSS
jgi:hypothetical protein